MKIMMVCLGNICRSPMAEGLMREKIINKNLGWTVESSGTGSYHIGESPDNRAQEMMITMGHDISDLRAQQFDASMLDKYDLIFCMDRKNYEDVISHADDEQLEKVHMILSLLSDDEYFEVPDPYFNNRFQLVYRLLDEATDQIFEKWNDEK